MTQPKTPHVFRVDAQGDTLYIEAASQKEARAILVRYLGEISASLLTWSGPMPLPEGEEALKS